MWSGSARQYWAWPPNWTGNMKSRLDRKISRKSEKCSDYFFFNLSRILGPRIKSGVLSVPFGIKSSLTMSGQTDQILPTDSPIRVIEGAKDNLPDESSLGAAKEISTLVSSMGEGDILFVLVMILISVLINSVQSSLCSWNFLISNNAFRKVSFLLII